MTLPSLKAEAKIALLPLAGNQQTEESYWLGALLCRLLVDHLSAAGLPVFDYNPVAEQMTASKVRLPPDEPDIQTLRRELKAEVLVFGRYVIDPDSQMLGLRLILNALESPPGPLEAAAPLSGFPAFIERISLALIERLGIRVDDALRTRVREVPRPAKFEAFRQLALATLAWSKGENQLALAAVESALTLDADLEDAATIQVAIARAADDTATTREAFRRWAAIAGRRRRPLIAAERLMMMGHWLLERGEWPEARKGYEDAREIYQTARYEYGMACALNNLANIDMLSGKIQAAIQVYRRTLRLFEGEPDSQADRAITCYNLAIAHKALGQQEEAERAIEESLMLARQLKDTYLEGRALAQRGAVRDDMGQWTQAGADYGQSARLLDVISDDAGLALVKSHQAILKKQQGAYEEAAQLLVEALSMLESSKDIHQRAVIWFNLADLYLAMQLYDRAWDYAG